MPILFARWWLAAKTQNSDVGTKNLQKMWLVATGVSKPVQMTGGGRREGMENHRATHSTITVVFATVLLD